MREGADVVGEARRQLTICNACRYCEGYCAVFPALERRKIFSEADVFQLANLCHDCRDCYDACMFAPPHEFALNLPDVFASVRASIYERHSWPRGLFALLSAAGGALLLLLLCWVVVLVALVVPGQPGRLLDQHTGPGSFYIIAPYLGLVIPGLTLFLYGVVVWTIGARRFWSETRSRPTMGVRASAILTATIQALTLKWMRGGGAGCYYDETRGSRRRFVLHGLTFWGFLLATISTILAAIYQDVLGIDPPFAILTPPVLFGLAGGVAMIIGSTGLLISKWRDRAPFDDSRMRTMDYGFILVLDIASITGMLTLLLRSTRLMGLIFALHLGAVAALFIAAPYGKFVHAVYRYTALVRDQIEQQAGFGGTAPG